MNLKLISSYIAASTRSAGPVAGQESAQIVSRGFAGLFTLNTRLKAGKTEFVVRFVKPMLTAGEGERVFADMEKAYDFMESEYPHGKDRTVQQPDLPPPYIVFFVRSHFLSLVLLPAKLVEQNLQVHLR